MTDPRLAAVLNIPDALILSQRKMRSRLLPGAVACLIVGSCAPPPATQVPVSAIPQPSPPLVLPPFQMDTGFTADRVPPFQPEPLIVWGPPPAGVSHAERTRTYDLQHQTTTVRFDWTRQAVVGSTTLRIGGLSGAAPLSAISVDAGDMTFSRVASGDTPLKYDYDGHAIVVHLAAPLRADGNTSITIDYDGANRTKGAYFRPARHIVWTQGETEDNHFWVPTYDFPNDKTTWEFYIWTAKGERALSNGRLAGSRPVGDSIEWHWVLEKPASTYLMTAVVGKYTVLQDKPWRSVTIGYWTYPDSVQAAWRGFANTPQAVDLFSRKTGVPYPWNKYDQIVIPEFQYGGMENVTATSQNDLAILHPAWAEPQANSEGLMSHELGHQWYGDLLTTRRWGDVWLNEGFATFMEQVFREEARGVDEGAFDRLGAQEQTIDADRRGRRPIVWDKWVDDPIEVFFSGHIYPKGATILQMLRHQLGDAAFWKAMNRYTTANAYGNVVTDDLRKAFEASTGRSFKTFFDQWVYGAGFPVFQVSSLYDRAASRVVVSAREVQPRDSLTGFFDVDVDVEVRTDAGIVRFVVPVRNGTGEAGANVKAPPRSIRWDKGNWLLDITDFPRSTAMMRYQLVNDDDVLGRIEAVDILAKRPGDQIALDALVRATRNDRFYGVRARAVEAVGTWASDPTRAAIPPMQAVKSALIYATRDPDARVRQEAVTALGRLTVSGSVATEVTIRLREVARSDPSLIVRGAALASDIRLEKNAALPLAKQLMAQDVWQSVIRAPALNALKAIDTPEARELIQQYTPAAQ
ncbi:MAG TPA: M1 family metallopeptidase [Gemmatimonadaceae bacterium]|nr:M1 family metallopeptidase [Gemmatimonadaceae bacterium]